MNPFPDGTAANILNNLRQIGLKTVKPFRILIFEAAKDTLNAAERDPWLDLVESQQRSEKARYGFSVYQVNPAKLNEPTRYLAVPDTWYPWHDTQRTWLEYLSQKYRAWTTPRLKAD